MSEVNAAALVLLSLRQKSSSEDLTEDAKSPNKRHRKSSYDSSSSSSQEYDSDDYPQKRMLKPRKVGSPQSPGNEIDYANMDEKDEFMFGATSQFKFPGNATANPQPTGGGGFGSLGSPAQPLPRSNSASGNLFGNTGTSASSGGMFGNAGTSTTSGGMFGNTGGNATSGGLFGNTGGATTSGGVFGNTGATASSGGMFGNTGATASSGGMFGNTNTAATPSGLFGGRGATANTASSGGLFGNTASTTAPSGGLFGNTANASTPSSLFGNTANASTPSSLFGGTAATAPSGAPSGLFGTSTNTAPSGLFGASNAPSGVFAPKTTSTPSTLFGNNATSQAFGSNPSNSMFNSTTTAPNLYASIDQASFSLAGSPYTSTTPILGPLTSPRRSESNLNSPSSLNNSKGRGSLKASSSLRFLSSAARNSPYNNSRNNNTGTLSKSRSELNLSMSPARRSQLRTERSVDDFKFISNGLKGQRSEIKRLVLNKSNVTAESITGSKSLKNGGYSRNQQKENQPFLTTPSFNRTQREQQLTTPAVPQMAEQTATQAGYWISPSLSDLYQLSKHELRSVDNLSIGRHGYGQLTYCQPVDLSKTNLSEILGNLVVFDKSKVCVYPDESKKPSDGSQLNAPAIVSLENAYPLDRKTNKPLTDPVDPRLIKHKQRLRSSIESRGGEFLSYNVDIGLWIFRVPHFSVWGFDPDQYDDEDEDVDMNEYLSESVNGSGSGDVNVNGNGNADHGGFEPQQVYNQNIYEEDDFIDLIQNQGEFINANDISAQIGDETLRNLGLDFNQQSMGVIDDDTFINRRANNGPAPAQTHNTATWGINENNLEYDSSDDEVQIIESSPSQISNKPSQELVPISIDSSDTEDLPQPRNWIDQLKYSSRIDSPFTVSTVTKQSNNDNFTTHDLDNLLYGGIDGLKNTTTSQYEEAAEKLRLPEMFSKSSFARFIPGLSERLLVKEHGQLFLTDIPDQTTISSSVIYNLINRQIPISNIDARVSNGLPLITPKEELTMKFLSIHSNPASTEEKELWELASILFDDIYSNGLEKAVDSGLDIHIQERIKEQHRRKLLSNWLQKVVSKSVNNDGNNITNPLDSIFNKVTGNLLQDAVLIAIRSNNLHLSTLLPLLGTDDRQIREDALSQIEDWKNQRAIFHIPLQIRKIYELIGGNTQISKGSSNNSGENTPTVYLSEGLDWYRAFGLKLWYGSNRRVTIPEVVESYKQAFENKANKVAAPFVNGSSTKYDVKYHLLRLYGSMNPVLSSVLETVTGAFDYREAWYIYIVLVLSSGLFSDIGSKLGDKLSIEYGCQLENIGLWVDSIFVFSHIRNDNLAKLHIERVISHHIDEILNDQRTFDRLVNEFKIPESYLYASKALLARSRQDYLEESINLIKGELWQEAHKTIVTKVAPRAVIENRPNAIRGLLKQIAYPQSINIYSWDVGGQMYLDYAELVDLLQQDNKNEEKISQLVNRLSKALANVKNESNDSDVKVAISLMSSFVGKHGSKVSSVGNEMGLVEH